LSGNTQKSPQQVAPQLQAAKTTPNAAFPTLYGGDQDGKFDCLCGENHRYKECMYITPSTRPQGWTGKPEIFDYINKAKPKKLEWFKTAFNYNGVGKGTKTSDRTTTTETANQSTTPRVTEVTAISLFTTASTGEYKLYNSWMMDNASNIHERQHTRWKDMGRSMSTFAQAALSD
jgi:hypothetical protein